MRYRRKPAEVHAEQLDPADLKGSIELLDGFLPGGRFDYNLDAESEEEFAAVLTYPHSSWETLSPGWWVVRWAEDCYTIMDDEEFRRDFEKDEPPRPADLDDEGEADLAWAEGR